MPWENKMYCIVYNAVSNSGAFHRALDTIVQYLTKYTVNTYYFTTGLYNVQFRNIFDKMVLVLQVGKCKMFLPWFLCD